MHLANWYFWLFGYSILPYFAIGVFLFLSEIEGFLNTLLKEGIRFVKQEKSYTSKASLLDDDEIPVW